MKKEEWRFIPGYEGLYMVSNWGQVKSFKFGKERILKPGKKKDGYLFVVLFKDRKQKTLTVHSLVWDTFGNLPRNGRILQVDHINNDKTDNRIENLQLLSHRENNLKKIYENKSSKYKGVSFFKQSNKWRTQIYINGKNKCIGYFTLELDAAEAYLKAKENFELFNKQD